MRRIFFLTPALLLAACEPTAESRQREATNQLMADAEARVGMPKIVNFTEKKIANLIAELRDRPNLATYTYRTDMNGGAHCLGHSIGFGLPYTTQITNPQKYERAVTLPQAEPNGLYSSDSTSATWVLLVGKKGEPLPTYVEDDIVVSLEPLATAVEQCR